MYLQKFKEEFYSTNDITAFKSYKSIFLIFILQISDYENDQFRNKAIIVIFKDYKYINLLFNR